MKSPLAVRLKVRPALLKDAREACALYHRHLPPPPGGLVAGCVEEGGADVGWVIVGRPVSRALATAGWAEVTRCIVPPWAPPNVASMLLGWASRWAKQQGKTGLVTYTLAHEPGASLRGAGYLYAGKTRARKTWACASRERDPREGAIAEAKHRWVAHWCGAEAERKGWRKA